MVGSGCGGIGLYGIAFFPVPTDAAGGEFAVALVGGCQAEHVGSLCGTFFYTILHRAVSHGDVDFCRGAALLCIAACLLVAEVVAAFVACGDELPEAGIVERAHLNDVGAGVLYVEIDIIAVCNGVVLTALDGEGKH